MKKVLLSIFAAVGLAGAAVSAQAATYVTTTHTYHRPVVVHRVYHRPVYHRPVHHRPVVVKQVYHR